MKCYLIKSAVRERYAATQADAKLTRDDMMEQTSLKKTEVTIETIELPAHKAGMLEFINGLCARSDLK